MNTPTVWTIMVLFIVLVLGTAGAVWLFSDKVPTHPVVQMPTGTSTTPVVPPKDTHTETPLPTPAPAGRGTLSGTMTIGPICPVERVDNPCKPTPEMYAAHKIAVYASDKKTLITILSPDATGAFSTSLPAGSYYVVMASFQSVGNVKGVPATITIASGATTHLSIDIDTGIR